MLHDNSDYSDHNGHYRHGELMARKRGMTAKDIQAEFKVSASAINYYTALGLLRVIRRQGTTRFYDARVTRQRMKRTRALLDRGYTLQTIKEQLDKRR